MPSDSRPSPLPPLLVDRLEAGRLLGVCANTIGNLRKRGELVSVKVGSRRLYAVADLQRFIDRRKGAAE